MRQGAGEGRALAPRRLGWDAGPGLGCGLRTKGGGEVILWVFLLGVLAGVSSHISWGALDLTALLSSPWSKAEL